jgi:hypothetical protein
MGAVVYGGKGRHGGGKEHGGGDGQAGVYSGGEGAVYRRAPGTGQWSGSGVPGGDGRLDGRPGGGGDAVGGELVRQK